MLKLAILILIILYLCLAKSKFNYFVLNPNMKIKQIDEDIFEIEDIYKYPSLIRKHYLKKDFTVHDSVYKTWFYNPNLRNSIEIINLFESLINKKISVHKWNIFNKSNSNGFLQYMTNVNNPCIHSDYDSDYAAVVYLGDNNHPLNGTSFYQHKKSGLKERPTNEQLEKLSPEIKNIYKNYAKNDLWVEGEKPQFDKWNKYYQCENKFNKAVVFNSRRFHCAEKGYGTNKYDCRFFQTFFFCLD